VRPELQAVLDEFEAASSRLQSLCHRAPAEQWARRPAPDRWSIGECVAHLNLTSAGMLPRLRSGLDEARRSGHAAAARYRRDPIGWLIWRTQGPPPKRKFKTAASFVPRAARPMAELVAEFHDLQAQQMALVREADGLPITRVRMTSPFDSRVKYNLFSALTILPRHQHRHLWQAEQTLA
jgi:DinB superfamily